jgi:serine/threonine-protein kinase
VAELLEHLQHALADRYRIERELGAGGMATVFLAQDLKHHRQVALKVLRPEIARVLGGRFQREIETTAQLTHPHILPLLDSGDADGTLFYVMPFVEGESLRDRLTREKQLPLDDALQITREAADALGYAHNHGVVHRDIKPENILLESGHAVVADFGIARAIDQAGGERLTETGVTLGTPAYMSPEQSTGSRAIDGRSDVYSLGCVLYEMLSAETPYTGPTPMAIMARKLADPLPRISVVRETVPPRIEAALAKALARMPADRYATAAEFASALAASPDLPSGEVGSAKPRARRIAALVTALLVVAAGAGVVLKTGVLGSGSGSGSARLSSLAVLPLVNLSGDSTQDYFADGMTDALITELDQIAALTVISAHTAMLYKRSPKSTPEIARELHVQAVVEGSVQRERGHVRITARLIDGSTDRRVWDSTYDREAASVLALQAEVARTIAGAIGAKLTPEETRRLQVSRSVNPQAYDEYLLGRHQASLWTAAGFARAILYYREAIADDASFPDPHAELVDAYWWLTALGSTSPKESAPLVKAAAERAVALDPGSARAHAALAEVRSSFEWRWQEADAEFRRALELNPGLSDVHSWYALFLANVGRHEEAVEHALRAVALDPLQADLRSQLAWQYFYAGRFGESITVLEKALELDPTFYAAHLELGWDYSALGRHPEAIGAVDQALKSDPENQVVLACAVWIYARAGRLTDARHHLDALLAQGRKGRWVDPYNVGWAYAFLGETDRALESFNRAIEEHSVVAGGLKIEFLPAAFKADPRYHALLRRVRLE